MTTFPARIRDLLSARGVARQFNAGVQVVRFTREEALDVTSEGPVVVPGFTPLVIPATSMWIYSLSAELTTPDAVDGGGVGIRFEGVGDDTGFNTEMELAGYEQPFQLDVSGASSWQYSDADITTELTVYLAEHGPPNAGGQIRNIKATVAYFA